MRVLDSVLPAGAAGDSVRADLEEEFREHVERFGAHRARRWFGWEALKLSAHFFRGRWMTTGGERGGGMDTVRHNLTMALRQFRKAPGFTATCVVTIGLGIGANAAIFSVVSAVLLDPLPYDDPEELVAIWEWNRPRDQMNNVANPGNFAAWRDGSEAFERMTAVSLLQPRTVTTEGEPGEAMVQFASPDFFAVLGLEAGLGRTFDPDPAAGEPTEAVLAHHYWRERFGADPNVVGRTVQLNGTPLVVVGVLPPSYVVFGEGTDLWASIRVDVGDQTNSGRWLMVLGRLGPGATLAAADAELKAIAAGLEEAFPSFNAGWTVNLVPLADEVVGDVRRMLWVLLGSVALLLVIACANVANLFLVRATSRQQEMAVRTSLGASGHTLAGQLLAESLAIAGTGAVVGVVAAQAATRWLATRMPDAFALPRVEGAGVDARVLAFAVLVTIATALVFGLVPALQASGSAPGGTLSQEGRGASRRTGRMRDALVIAEVALSVVLLAGAVLFTRSFSSLMDVDDGIEADDVLVGRVDLAGPAYGDAASRVAFFDELMDRIGSSGGVEAVGGITFLPMDGAGAATGYWVTDRPVPDPEDRLAADVRNVSGDYFRAMGVQLLQGRLFDDRDHAGAPQTIIINRRLADRYWADESPIGKQIVVNWVDETPWEVVGVVEDVRMVSLDVEPRDAVYIHYAKGAFFPWLHLTVRSRGRPESLIADVRRELAEMDPALPLGSVRVMKDIVARSAARPRVTTALMSVFAVLATLLAAVGLYGVLAYTVTRRVREIGVRIALGAEPRRVVRLIVLQGSRLVAVGVVLGVGASLVGGRFVRSLLYDVSPTDPLSITFAGVALACVGLAATIIPAWRASSVAPAEALRPE